MYSCENIYMEVMTNEISIEVFIREHPWWVLSLVLYNLLCNISCGCIRCFFISQDGGGGKESAMKLNDEVKPPGYSAFARLP